MKKIVKSSVIVIGIIGLIIFIVYNIKLNRDAEKKILERSYHGNILEIKKFESNRGLLSIRIEEDWIHFGFLDEKAADYIQVEDSIAKESGSKTINVYRKDSNGEWNVKVFE